MADPVRTAAIITHERPSLAATALREVVPLLRERGIHILVAEGECAKHPEVLGSSEDRFCHELAFEDLTEVDVHVVLGGDGTILRALRRTHATSIPVVGVNLGQVGFFAAVARDNITEELGRIVDGDYVSYELPGIIADLERKPVHAVNDIVVSRGRSVGVCRLSYSLNSVQMFDLRCDGLVVATPQGSSAYNLATGGPLVGLGLDGYVISYIAPHTLRSRSVVASGRDLMRIRNQSDRDVVEVLADGAKHGTLVPGGELLISFAGTAATLALLPENSFYDHFRTRFF